WSGFRRGRSGLCGEPLLCCPLLRQRTRALSLIGAPLRGAFERLPPRIAIEKIDQAVVHRSEIDIVDDQDAVFAQPRRAVIPVDDRGREPVTAINEYDVERSRRQ